MASSASDVMLSGVTDDPIGPPRYEEAFPPLPPSNSTAPIIPLFKPAVNLPALKKSQTTQVIEIPLGERRFPGAGETQFGGRQQDAAKKICMEIATSTGVTIDLNYNKDRSLLVSISGKAEHVTEAKRRMTKELCAQIQHQMQISREYHGFILGRQGAKLRELEAETDTRVQVPRAQDGSDTVTITGSKEGVERAQRRLRVIVDEQSKLAFERVKVPKIYHPFICGPLNSVVNRIREETGAKVNIPPSSVPSEEITVTGEREGVMKAVNEIEAIHREKASKCQTVSISISKNQHRYILGPKGAGLAEILETTGVWVELPPTDSQSEELVLRGSPDKLGAAVTMVYDRAGSMTSLSVPAPAWLHRIIIGKSGTSLNKLREGREKVQVNFIEESDQMTIEGPTADAQAVADLLRARVAELLATMASADVNVDPRFHRHIVGRAGANIARLQEEHKVRIRMPATEGNWTVRIEGDPAGVEHAKQEISAVASKLENEKQREVTINHSLHRLLIGSQGSRIRELRDEFPDVAINFPDAGCRSDIVVVRGPRQQVDTVASRLERDARDVQENNYTSEVRIFRPFHRHLLSKGSAAVRKIRDETETKVDLPSAEENLGGDLVVRVTGRRTNVEDAVRRIEKMQEEMGDIKETTIPVPAGFLQQKAGENKVRRLLRVVEQECGGVVIQARAQQLVVRGPAEDVDRATQRLKDVTSKGVEQYHEESVSARRELHRYLQQASRSAASKPAAATTTPSAPTLDQFRKRHPQVLLAFPTGSDSDQERDTVRLLGSKDAVAKAKLELEELIKAMEAECVEWIQIDPKWHRHFFARRQAVMEELSREYGGVKLFFPRQQQDTDQDRVRLVGPKSCVEAVRERIRAIIDELAAQTTLEVTIDRRHHRTLLTRSLDRVKELQNDLHVTIKFPSVPAQGPRGDIRRAGGGGNDVDSGTAEDDATANGSTQQDDSADIVVITGRSENCETARQALLLLVPVEVELPLASEFHRSLIGQGGRGIADFQREFNISVTIPPADNPSDFITVRGTPDQIDKVRQTIADRLQQWEADKADRVAKGFEVQVDIPVKFHRQIIGQRGATVNELRKKFNVQIHFGSSTREDASEAGASNSTGGTGDVVVVRGYQESAEQARDELLALVKKLESQVTESLHIPSELHPLLIGARGQGVRKIREQYHVEINFPGFESSGEDANTVVVTGESQDVDAVCDLLIDKANELHSELKERNQIRNLKKQSGIVVSDHRDGEEAQPANQGQQNGTPPPRAAHGGRGKPGFVVAGAPWHHSPPPPNTSSQEDFPSMPTNQQVTSGSGGSCQWGSRNGQTQ